MKPIHIRKILNASVRVTPSVSLPCEQSKDSFLKTEESLFQISLRAYFLTMESPDWRLNRMKRSLFCLLGY